MSDGEKKNGKVYFHFLQLGSNDMKKQIFNIEKFI